MTIFSELDSKTDFVFSYGQYVLNKKEKYDVVYKNSPLDKVLDNLSKKANFRYEINGINILIAKKDNPHQPRFQQTTIQGKIINEQGATSSRSKYYRKRDF